MFQSLEERLLDLLPSDTIKGKVGFLIAQLKPSSNHLKCRTRKWVVSKESLNKIN